MSNLINEINSLALLRGVRNCEPLQSLCEFLKKSDDSDATVGEKVELYSKFVSKLYELRSDANLTEAIWDLLVSEMNPYLGYMIAAIINQGEGVVLNPLLETALDSELDIMTKVGKISPDNLKAGINYYGYLPLFSNSPVDFKEKYKSMIRNIPKSGYGIYAKYRSFKFENGKVNPIKQPDPISVEDLFCYERQREKIINNTIAFINGKPAADALLYGDAGTGKSSTVKAVAKMYENEGVRLVELPKSEINNLNKLIEIISQVPMKFILYIDDLSFEANDERIGSLKSVLEGAAAGGRKNIIIYVTSNRRHMIKETFSDRSDEIHASDTIAEQMSLSERFGLRVLFDKPNKFEFIKIAQELATARGITMDEEEFKLEAEKFALRNGGRSARLARQFVDSLDC